MAVFGVAVAEVLQLEGGRSADAGGLTKYGIAQAAHPGRNVATLTEAQAVAIYDTEYWQPYGYAALRDQALATKVFSLAVNMGPRTAHRLLQQALLRLGVVVPACPGRLSSDTLAQVNGAPAGVLLDLLRVQAAHYYLALNQPRFERGWLRRALM